MEGGGVRNGGGSGTGGGDSGGYSHVSQKPQRMWHLVVFECGQSFSCMGSHLHMWVVVSMCGWPLPVISSREVGCVSGEMLVEDEGDWLPLVKEVWLLYAI